MKRSFILVEFLACLLLPAMSKSKEIAKRIFCLGNHKQQSVVFSMYADDWHGFLPNPYQNAIYGK